MTDLAGDWPLLVEATRGALVESRHRAAAAVVDATGRLIRAWGDVDQPVYGRSAVKPLQAIPLVETGAADRFGLGPPELALACASHHAEPAHLAVLEAWMARVGLGVADLECGTHEPADPTAAAALIRAGGMASAIHNNCSGKHLGFLTTARHLGEPTAGYIAPDHPVQRRVRAVLEDLCGTPLDAAPCGTDGCGIPVIGVSLTGLACGMARMAAPDGLPPARAAAARRLLDAMAAEPLMVSGSTGFATRLMRVVGAKIRVKPGAEGTCCAALPQHGLGIALKVADGGPRAVDVAMGAVLTALGILDPAEQAALADLLRPPIRNVAGRVVGELRPG